MCEQQKIIRQPNHQFPIKNKFLWHEMKKKKKINGLVSYYNDGGTF